ITSSEMGFKNLVWNKTKGFAFLENLETSLEKNQNHKLNYYDCNKKELYTLNPADFTELNDKCIIKPFGQKAIVIEQNDDKIIFFINNRQKKESKVTLMEIWESDSPLEYPSQAVKGDFENANKMAIWWPVTNMLNIVATNQKPKTIMCPNSDYVLSFNPLDYEPQFELAAPVDLYLTDVKTHKTTLLLKKQSQKELTMGASAIGRYLHYYRNKNWWIYDITKNIHTNITYNMPFTVENYKQDEAGAKYAFGCAGWSNDNKHIFIYDEFDIWMITPDGKTKNRLTNGRPSQTQFRVEEDLYVNKFHRGSIEFLTTTFNKKQGIIFTAIDRNMNIGYYSWNEKDKLQKVHLANSKSNRIKYAAKTKEMVWIEQDASKPPRLIFKKNSNSKAIVLYQTNRHYKEYNSCIAELVQYKNSKGDSLKGVLYYPSSYKKEKKYPMIVYIYEKLSQRLHLYENPTLFNRDGFSMANYVHDDYFVLYPDIIYEVGNPGVSATDCVVSAVQEVLKTDKVDSKKIGIIGHSFGGYQVASIITQTNIFKTAVAGAAITDLTNLYLQMNWTWNRTQAWRLESQQLRMGSSPFNNFDGYKINSPVLNAAAINTPLLSWSGKEDYDVNWNHSIYLHMALRKLQKKNTMLLFPNEGHNILNPETQQLLSREIKKWFAFYLKE
ncbi:MAG: prolyl oligopeptidase family serine peptidase, partial [Flavobacterium sp.]|nr:prolyl oligopeptidase family serine peptidase [Flavobacterium sp.]